MYILLEQAITGRILVQQVRWGSDLAGRDGLAHGVIRLADLLVLTT